MSWKECHHGCVSLTIHNEDECPFCVAIHLRGLAVARAEKAEAELDAAKADLQECWADATALRAERDALRSNPPEPKDERKDERRTGEGRRINHSVSVNPRNVLPQFRRQRPSPRRIHADRRREDCGRAARMDKTDGMGG